MSLEQVLPCMHWSGLIVDHIRGAMNAGIRVYQDSLSMMTASSTSNVLKTQLTGTPLLNNGGGSLLGHSSSPRCRQQVATSDCAAHMCANLLRISRQYWMGVCPWDTTLF